MVTGSNADAGIWSPDRTFAPQDASSLSPKARAAFCREWLTDRQRGRVDLLWLCNEVLTYRDVCAEVHGPVIQHVQGFYGREEYMDPNTFELKYTEPRCGLHEDQSCDAQCVGRTCWYLPGPRFRMLLDPRGHLKTTVNTIAHGIQWMLNFEDIRIILSTATGPQGADIITEIENHFRYNPKLRWLYPEYCPPDDKVSDWGSKAEFIIPCRRRKWLKEPTMRVVSIGKVIAGQHAEVIKHSDLVDKENVKTPGGLKDTKDHFKYTMPLLERGPDIPGRGGLTRGWVDLEGTIYDHSDLYCEELDKDDERAQRGQPCRWAVFRRDACINPVENSDGDIDWTKPFTTLWPIRFPFDELKAIHEDIGDYLFNCQYRLSPKARGVGLCRPNEIGYFPARFKKVLRPKLYMKTTIDLAGMEEDADGCNISILTCGHAKDGRKYVFESLVGRPTPFEIINYVFELDTRYSNLAQKLVIQMEKASHAEALLPFIHREMETRQQWLNLVAIPRDSSVSKDNRIFYGLQPWFRRKLVWLSDDIPTIPHIVKEITKFPKYKFKDWLDTLTDQAQDKEGKIDYQVAVPERRQAPEDPLKLQKGRRFLGFHPVTKEPMFDHDDTEAAFPEGLDNAMYYHDTMTGAL